MDIGQVYHFFANLEGFKVLETSYREDYGPNDLIDENDGFPLLMWVICGLPSH